MPTPSQLLSVIPDPESFIFLGVQPPQQFDVGIQQHFPMTSGVEVSQYFLDRVAERHCMSCPDWTKASGAARYTYVPTNYSGPSGSQLAGYPLHDEVFWNTYKNNIAKVGSGLLLNLDKNTWSNFATKVNWSGFNYLVNYPYQISGRLSHPSGFLRYGRPNKEDFNQYRYKGAFANCGMEYLGNIQIYKNTRHSFDFSETLLNSTNAEYSFLEGNSFNSEWLGLVLGTHPTTLRPTGIPLSGVIRLTDEYIQTNLDYCTASDTRFTFVNSGYTAGLLGTYLNGSGLCSDYFRPAAQPYHKAQIYWRGDADLYGYFADITSKDTYDALFVSGGPILYQDYMEFNPSPNVDDLLPRNDISLVWGTSSATHRYSITCNNEYTDLTKYSGITLNGQLHREVQVYTYPLFNIHGSSIVHGSFKQKFGLDINKFLYWAGNGDGYFSDIFWYSGNATGELYTDGTHGNPTGPYSAAVLSLDPLWLNTVKQTGDIKVSYCYSDSIDEMVLQYGSGLNSSLIRIPYDTRITLEEYTALNPVTIIKDNYPGACVEYISGSQLTTLGLKSIKQNNSGMAELNYVNDLDLSGIFSCYNPNKPFLTFFVEQDLLKPNRDDFPDQPGFSFGGYYRYRFRRGGDFVYFNSGSQSIYGDMCLTAYDGWTTQRIIGPTSREYYAPQACDGFIVTVLSSALYGQPGKNGFDKVECPYFYRATHGISSPTFSFNFFDYDDFTSASGYRHYIRGFGDSIFETAAPLRLYTSGGTYQTEDIFLGI